MFNIFEAKSYRVKGLSFHPTKPWILSSLHNGTINLYDYINGTLLNSFEDSDGPVRSVDFHYSQPIFVSGGDDTKIKVWNYQTKKSSFTLSGHTDYIRSVKFHHELPWIISASDDQTVRIWNWQNRSLLTTATGHDHYVMTAFFHPTHNLIVSSSLDQSIRVWDYSNLRKKYYEAKSTGLQVIEMDVVLKHKIDGNERSVNWAVFHPTLNLIASGSDDKTLRIFKYSDVNWQEVEVLRNHTDNITSCIFHPTYDFIFSVSEDCSMKIWDINKKKVLFSDKKEKDRFWVIIKHPNDNIFATGTDVGLNIFKIEKTRSPSSLIYKDAFLLYKKEVFYIVKDGDPTQLFVKNLNEKISIKPFKNQIEYLVSNPFLFSNNNSSSIQLLNFFIKIKSVDGEKSQIIYYLLKPETSFKTYNGIEHNITCTSAVFISKNKLLTLDLNNNLNIIDTSNVTNSATIDLINIMNESIDSIHQAVQSKVLLKLKNGIVCLYDINARKITNETNELSDLKFVSLNQSMTYTAIVGTNSISILSKNFEIVCKVKENSHIKSVCWDETGVLFYTTFSHVKYLLTSGLSGIIKSTESPFYINMIHKGIIHYSDSKFNQEKFSFNYNEINFNKALSNKNHDEILHYLKSSQINSVKSVENLKNFGFPDLSYNFVNDNKLKFVLALKSGDLDEAKRIADLLKNKVYYNKLAERAMISGKLSLVEYCYVRAGNTDKLIFFYILSGKYDKLKKLESILKDKSDYSKKFLTHVYLCNNEEKIKLLSENGHCKIKYNF